MSKKKNIEGGTDMRVLEKLTMKERKNLVWAAAYDYRFVRAGHVTSTYFMMLETLLDLIIIQEGGQFKDAEECVITLKATAWNGRYVQTSTYNSEKHDWQGPDYYGKGEGSYLGWNLFRNITEPNTGLIDWLASIDAVAFYMAMDSCWTPAEIIINGVSYWKAHEDDEE